MDGMIDGFMVSFFTGVQQNPEARKNRQLTILEITDSVPFVDGVAAGSSEMKAFIELINTLTWHNMEGKKWDKQHLIASRHKESVEAFLTDSRIKILNEMLSFPSSDVIVIFDDVQGVFRFETTNPLTDADKIDEMLQKLFARIKKLRPSEEEIKKFKSLRKAEEAAPPPVQEEKPVEEAAPEETKPEEKEESKEESKD